MKPFRTPMTTIGNLKITNISGGASINFGPAFHKGHQANAKIETGEFVIGDEINIGCPPEDEEEEEENETNEELDSANSGDVPDEDEEDNEKKIIKEVEKKRWKWKEGKFQKED